LLYKNKFNFPLFHFNQIIIKLIYEKYSNSNLSHYILIINKNGITRLYCPFKVKAIEDVFNLLNKGKEYHVEKVKIGRDESVKKITPN
jgi:hypothetical protein